MKKNICISAIIIWLLFFSMLTTFANETVDKEKNEPIIVTNQEEAIRLLEPLDKVDESLNKIWLLMKSDNVREKNIAWKTFLNVWKFSDGMECNFFTRFCWFKCREEPLAFYLRYLEGDRNSIQFYELASMYDIYTFREDKISEKEVVKVFEIIKSKIAEYNKKNLIEDDEPLTVINNCLIRLKRTFYSSP